MARGRHRAAAEPQPTPERSLLRGLAAFAGVVGVGVAVLAVVTAAPWEAAGGEPGGPPGEWTTVFADEFDGAALDTEVWQPDRSGSFAGIPFNPVPEDAWFSPDQVAVTDGHLTLTVTEEPNTLEGVDYRFSSGVVQSTAALTLEPTTYVEAHIRFPDCDGCWPAFWLHPTDRWPPEIDIAEFLESGSESRPSFNYIDPAEQKTGPDMYGDPDVDYRDVFHTYGVLWDGERAVPYLDGRPYGEFAATGVMTSLPMMIILNLSVRGGYDTEPGAQMLVDWVRVSTPAS